MNLADVLKSDNSLNINPIKPEISDKDYFVPKTVWRELYGAALTIKNIKDFGEMGDRNYIFSGPPGTGKTLGVLYLATLVDGLVYDGKLVNNSDAVRDTFAQLREVAKKEKKPLFFVINEVDKFSSRENIIDPQQQACLNALLDEMQGFDKNEGIYIFGTTNKPDSLDPALRRPGRFSKEIEILPPDKNGRLKILEIHAYNKKHKFKVDKKDLEKLSEKTYGYTGADLYGLLNETFVEALRNGRKDVINEDIDFAFSRTKPSAIRDMPFREPSLKLDDLAGYETHKELLKKLITDESDNKSIKNGKTMLFYGPQGTGKTVFAEALAGEYGYNLLFISGSELESKWVGESKDRLAKVYSRAKQLKPCIVVFDEIDSFLETKGWISHQKEQTGYIQSVLSKPEDGVYVIGTTNNPHFLKDAMLDRFLYKLYFGLPKGKAQEAVWEKYLPKEISATEMLQDNLTCRAIANACTKVKTYGNPTKEAIKNLVKGKTTDERAYLELAKTIGDDVSDYELIKSH